MGGWYKVWTDILVNADNHHNDSDERLRISFCHNWAGDDWFVSYDFKGETSGRIHAPDTENGYYASFYYYDRLLRRFVKEFIVKEKPCTFKAINKITKELTGMIPKWSLIQR